MTQFFQTLMWATAIIVLMMGLLIHFVFRRQADHSAQDWVTGCLFMASGMVILTIRQHLPTAIGYGLNNFIMIYAMVLFRNSFWRFANQTFRPTFYPILFSAYHGSAIWLLSLTPYRSEIGWLAAINWSLLYIWLLLDSLKLRRLIQNSSYVFFITMTAAGLFAWGTRAIIASHFNILSASDPQILNITTLALAHAALIGQQFSYFAARFTDEKNKKDQILQLNASLERLWQENNALMTARQKERNDLLRDMHDGFGSQIASLRILAEHGSMTPSDFSAALSDIYADLHLISDTLNQPDAYLRDHLADLRYRLTQRIPASQITLHWQVHLENFPKLPPRGNLHILRILQEAINNSLRHAQPANIWITADFDQTTQIVKLSVRDDGTGITHNPRPGRGLANMKSRAKEIGGKLSLISLPRGTAILLEFSVKKESI